MNLPPKTKKFVFISMLALVIEGIVFGVMLTFGHIGGDGPDLIGGMGLVLHALPLMVSEWLKLPGGNVENTVCIVFGTLQWFAVVSFLIWLSGRSIKVRPNKPVQTTAMTPPPSTTRGAPLSDL